MIAEQVEADLAAANGKFLQLHGPAGGAELDLYGRAATLHPHEQPSPATSRAGSLKERNTSKTGRLRYTLSLVTHLYYIVASQVGGGFGALVESMCCIMAF